MVIGYVKAKSKAEGKPYVRIDVVWPQKEQYGGQGFQVASLFLPDAEHYKATPDIVGKIAHCDSQQSFVGRPERNNFVFLDE